MGNGDSNEKKKKFVNLPRKSGVGVFRPSGGEKSGVRFSDMRCTGVAFTTLWFTGV